jgi:hypothetical protein
MSLQRMDADTAETVAGVLRLLRRAAQLVWDVVDAERPGSPRQMMALAIDLAADEERSLQRTAHWPATRTRLIWFAWPACKHSSTEAAARKGQIDSEVIQRLAPALEAEQVASSRLAKRWGELTSPASRTTPRSSAQPASSAPRSRPPAFAALPPRVDRALRGRRANRSASQGREVPRRFPHCSSPG